MLTRADAAVFVPDILSDPLWVNLRDIASSAGLRSAWSSPIMSSDGKVLGTFGMYYREVDYNGSHQGRLPACRQKIRTRPTRQNPRTLRQNRLNSHLSSMKRSRRSTSCSKYLLSHSQPFIISSTHRTFCHSCSRILSTNTSGPSGVSKMRNGSWNRLSTDSNRFIPTAFGTMPKSMCARRLNGERITI
jgi:hypothetical protein